MPTRPRSRAGPGRWPRHEALGHRRLQPIGALPLEGGQVLPDVVLAFETWGELSATGDNAILVEHALTGDSHVCGQAGAGHPTAGWWDDLVGPGKTIDTDRWFVVCANAIGGCRGSTGPSSAAPDGRPWGSRFPFLTIRDLVAAEARLADALTVASWAMVLGGSMGGMRALEWAAGYPERVGSALVIASTGYATADQIAWCQPQILAIRHDPAFLGGDYYLSGRAPEVGMGIARRIAHTTYRSAAELGERFGRQPQEGEDPLGSGGRYAVESYLDYHAQKLVDRFDPNSYLVLTQAMSSHDVGRGRGGVPAALRAIKTRVATVAVDSDRLFPVALSAEIARWAPGADPVRVISSPLGHDGFLTDSAELAAIVTSLLPQPGRPQSHLVG
ncbi:MAG TPA: homoserine O-acetyltransferase [Dermatophilaceae bacterium]|nr:homoserine O-acetyltransferase [Dermatophilaceae bacterium]